MSKDKGGKREVKKPKKAKVSKAPNSQNSAPTTYVKPSDN